MRNLTVFLVIGLISGVGFAAPATLTYQGRILKADASPFSHNNVSFIFQILSPTSNCVIFEEQVSNYNLGNGTGLFDVAIGSGTKAYPAGAFTVLDAVSNSALSFACKGGGTFVPLATDGRALRVKFHDGGAWNTITPDTEIRSVPYAAYAANSSASASAAKLGTYTSSDFLLKVGLPSCTGGKYLTWNGTSLDCTVPAGGGGGGSGTMTGITAGDGLTANGTAATTLNVSGTLAVDHGTTANKIVRLDGSAKLPAVDGSALTNVKAATLGTHAASDFVLMAGLPSCTGGKYLSWNGTVLECTVPAGGGGGSATTDAGDLTSGTLAAARLPSSVTDGLWTPASTDISRATGKVGIGTATPTAKLDVVGGAVVSRTNVVATGGTVDLAKGNNHLLQAVGGTAIVLQNAVDGGAYTLIVADTTARQYTFAGCDRSFFSPENNPTLAGTRSTYTVLMVLDGTFNDCYISWMTGFQ